MKKVSPINRALRTAPDNSGRSAPGADAPGNRLLNTRPMPVASSPIAPSTGTPAPVRSLGDVTETGQQQPEDRSGRDKLRSLFREYNSREQEEQYKYLEQKVSDAVGELSAKINTQEQQIQTLQNTLESERRLSQSAVANLKDLFDGNYQVLAEVTDRYENSQQSFVENRASFDRRLEFIQQESHESTNQLRAAIIKSQDEDRINLAESLRALADSIDREQKG